MRETTINCSAQVQRPGEFFKKLSPAALRDLESMEFPSMYEQGVLIFTEKESLSGLFLLLSREVKLSINSSEGKRLILSIAKAGEVLGLSSALSGLPCDRTAEVLYPSRIAVIGSHDFLAFLARHPDAYKTVTQELSLQYSTACEQLRTVGLSPSAPVKLARLLLEWSGNGEKTDAGTRFRFSLTHEEIGEFIGASRETVTRTLSIFKTRHLIAFHGSTLTIPSRMALEVLAGN